jgi:hypothetical protein
LICIPTLLAALLGQLEVLPALTYTINNIESAHFCAPILQYKKTNILTGTKCIIYKRIDKNKFCVV